MKTQNHNKKQLIKIDNFQAEILKKKFNQFKQFYDQEQSKFTTSDQTDYYIVSATYLKQWTQFASSHQTQRQLPNPMNHDLMDAGGQLKKGLVQSKDFQIVNQKIFDIIKSDAGFKLQRSAIMVKDQKRVPIYLDTVKYLKLSYRDINEIDYKRLHPQDLKIKICQISVQATVQQLKIQIKNNENIAPKYKIRLWKHNTENASIQKLHKYIKQKTQRMTSYRFDAVGKYIEDDKTTVQQLNLQQNQYILAQVPDEFSAYYFKTEGQAKCQNCFKYKQLPYPCGCKKVGYCSVECQEKDRHYHMRSCKFAEQQQINQDIQMKITKSSALGRVGLSNLGNTCFMNSCLQCLSNTTLLTQYFLKKYYAKEINKQNKLGSKGRLAQNYAKFIKNMWCQSNSTYSPHSLKAAVAKINSIFSGYAQHDSQQFFSFIADGLHEDLNRIINKPYVQSVQSKKRSDQVVSLQSWIGYSSRNQSIIVDLLTGQYKSKVVCPTCNLESITFDPFTTISLPIPEEPTVQTMKFFVIFNKFQKETLRMSFQYIKANTKQWLQTATKMLKRQPNDFVFYILTVFQNVYGFDNTSKDQIIQKIETENKNVFLLELSEQQKNLKDRVQYVVKLCKSSTFQKQQDNLWFKRPYFFERQGTTALDIYKRILRNIYSVFAHKKLFKNGQEDFVAKMLVEKPFLLVFKYKKSVQRYYGRTQTKFQKQITLNNLQTKMSELLQMVKNSKDYQIDARFTKDAVKLFQFEKMKKFSEAEDLKIKKNSKDHSNSVSLDDCFSVFEQKEELQPGNQWYCPQCKQHKLATKQMAIYKAPQIMILHLKRFKNKGTYRKQKNEKNIIFPHILDMNQYVINPQPMSSYINQMKNQGKYIESAMKVQYTNSTPQYELYAISNHYGGLGGGHYTAYAKNGQKWYQFNDSSVHSVSKDEIKGSGAYMLFYRRINSMVIL